MGTYVVTGSATGIGAAVRAQLNSAGHRVIGVDIKQSDIQADLASSEGRQQAVAEIIRHAPEGLTGLITCAGVASHMPDAALIASLNYFGSVALIDGLRHHLTGANASVVMISSNSAPHDTSEAYLAALRDGDEASARAVAVEIGGHQSYAGSKRAVAQWMRRQAPAMAREGIRINAVAPGFIETPMTDAVMNDPNYGDAIKQFLQSIPVGRAGQANEVANVICFLLSEQASFVSGSLVYIDGAHDAMFRPDAV